MHHDNYVKHLKNLCLETANWLTFRNCQQALDRHEVRQKNHAELFSSVKDLDLIVLMDVTYSMDNHIASAKDSINAILAQISSRFMWAKKHMRIGFVGYRDFMRRTYDIEENRFEVLDLPDLNDAEQSASRLEQFLSSVKAENGDDMAEDVVGGLLKVILVVHDR